MHSQNKIARLTALTLLFSYAELLLPRAVPFFRLGLANAVVLLAFSLPLLQFALLCILKAAASSLMAGTLFSPLFLLSLAQSTGSGLFMYAIFFLTRSLQKKIISTYGLSVLGSSLSAFIQIALASLFIGSGTFRLLGPILIFNTASGLVTAFLAEHLMKNNKEGECLPLGSTKPVVSTSSTTVSFSPTPSNGVPSRNAPLQILFILALLSASVSVFFIKNIWILSGFFVVSLIVQKIAGRRIMILPHLFMWLFIFSSSILIPNGKVIYKIAFLSITHGSLIAALQKALILSTVSALSQAATAVKLPETTLLGQSLAFYRELLESFKNTKGPLLERLNKTLGTFSSCTYES